MQANVLFSENGFNDVDSKDGTPLLANWVHKT